MSDVSRADMEAATELLGTSAFPIVIAHPKSGRSVVDLIMEYEDGNASADTVLELFSRLIKTGQVWTMQGSYGRAAHDLIEHGYLSKAGEILMNPDADDEFCEDCGRSDGTHDLLMEH